MQDMQQGRKMCIRDRSKDGAKDLLIPAIHACIQNVDVAAGQMEVHLLPGLR